MASFVVPNPSELFEGDHGKYHVEVYRLLDEPEVHTELVRRQMESETITFGCELSKARQHKHMTHLQLGEKAKVNALWLNLIEYGVLRWEEIPLEEITRVVDVLGVTLEQLEWQG